MPDDEIDKYWINVFGKFMLMYWKALFVMIWPLICLLVFLIGYDEKFRCLYVMCIMAGYWLTECIPLYATGLLPVALMPMLNIVSSKMVTIQYFNTTCALFLAGLMLAITIEHCELHRRIALKLMLLIGCSPRRLHLGLSVLTALISMWILNTAVTAIMCPIIMAILEQFESQGILTIYETQDDPDELPRPTKLTLAYFLSAAWSSTIGGIGTLNGTVTNLIYRELFETTFPNENKIDILNWFLFNFVVMIIMLLGNWILIQVMLMGMYRTNSAEYLIVQKGNDNKDTIREVIKKKLLDLGPMKWHETSVLVLCVLTIVMWLFRSPQFYSGWADLPYYKEGYIKDSAFPFIVIALLLILPSVCTCVDSCKLETTDRPKKPAPSLVNWELFQKKLPWGVLFLLGGGFALAYSANSSGLLKYLGEEMLVLKNLPSFIILAIVALITSLLTELAPNISACTLFIPVLMDMSVSMGVNPITYTYPAAICCSLAFCMPVGTPPNAIVVGAVNVRVVDFLKYGLPIKIWTWIVIIALFPTYGKLFF